jgi:hypothetical protein
VLGFLGYFTIAAARPEEAGRRTALVDGKGGRLKGLEIGVSYVAMDVDYRWDVGDEGAMDQALAILETKRPALLFVLLPMIDATGHSYGHESAQYLQAIVEADAQVGRLVDKLQELDIYDNTLIVILADHGMTGTSHGSSDPGDMTIPLIITGRRVPPGELENVKIVDIAPTLTALVGLPAPSQAEGKDLFENMPVPLIPPPDYIVIVTLDGCRPDKLLEAQTPNIDNLVTQAAYSWEAQTVYPSRTTEAHASLFTGAYPETHRYTYSGDTVEAETIFQVFERRVEEKRVELWVLVIVVTAMAAGTVIIFIWKKRARVQPLEPLATKSPQ